MAGPAQKKKEEPPKEVTVPQLAPQEIARRASAGYDLAVKSILDPKLRELRSDMAELRNMIMAGQKALKADASEDERNAALSKSIEDFKAKKPDSLLVKWMNMGNDPTENFSFEWKGNKATITFDMRTADAETWLKKPYADAKKTTVDKLIAASEPTAGGQTRIDYCTLAGFDTATAQQLTAALSKELSIGPNQSVPKGHLPITIAYASSVPDNVGVQGVRMEYAGPRKAGRIDMPG